MCFAEIGPSVHPSQRAESQNVPLVPTRLIDTCVSRDTSDETMARFHSRIGGKEK